MNSTAAGRTFEEKVFAYIKRELANGRLPFSREHCKVVHQKGYHSKDREDEIVFDIAIEVYRPGSTSYSMLVLVECKNYNHSVPVNDAEEFAEKIRQVAGAKGIMVSTGSFQQGTVSYCKSRHIGLVRYGNRKFDWILERTPWRGSEPFSSEVHAGLMSSSLGSYHPDLLGCVGDTYATSLDPLFRSLTADVADVATILKPVEDPVRSPRHVVDFISKEEIEQRSATVLRAVGYSGGQVPLDKICQWQAEEVGLNARLRVRPDVDDGSTHAALGQIRFDPLEITVFDRPNSHPGRENFTLAHELGHHFLGHSKYIAGEYCEEVDFEIDEPDDSATVGLADIRSMEWQANYFASCLLLPREPLLAYFHTLAKQLDLRNRGFGYIYLDDQPCNRHDYNRVTARLMLEYWVTKSAVKTRLQALGLLTDARNKERRLPPEGVFNGILDRHRQRQP